MQNEATEQDSVRKESLKHGAAFGLFSVVIISAGVYLSHIRFLDHEWLSRAGCLVVATGIWSGLGGIIREKVITGRLRVRARMRASRLSRTLRRGGADQARIVQEVEALKADSESQIKVISDRLRLSVGMLEISLLMTGTLLWGFGDLLPLGR